MALRIVLGDPDSAAKAFTYLRTELAKEKAVRDKAQIEVETLTWVVEDLNILADRFTTQILAVEEKVKHLDNKVLDGLPELRARNLCLE
jgi:hypothetical protein